MTHGGKRTRAGRKPGARALVTRSKAEGVLATVDEEKIWQRLLRSHNSRIVLDAMKYLTDRRDGKAVQAINADISGGVNIWDEELLARLEAGRQRVAWYRAQEREKELSA